MPRSRNKKAVNPLSLQWQFAENSVELCRNSVHWCEMMTASVTTIGLRMTSIGHSLQNNETPDAVELMRMVSEKQKAVTNSLRAAGKWQSEAMTPLKWPKAAPWLALDAGASAAGHLLAQHARWNKMMLEGFASTMRPFHSASTANALRLGKAKGKR